MAYKQNVISENQSDRILEYANLVLFSQEGDGERGGVQFCAPKFHMVKLFFEPNSRLLFMGCGNGEEVKQAIDLGYDAYGLTLNKDNLDYAKKEYSIDLVRADMHSTLFETGTFDGVISFQTFEHSYSPLFFLLECNRLLRDEGRVFVEYPGMNSGTMFDDSIHHVICCTLKQLKSLFIQANFKDIQVGTVIGDNVLIDEGHNDAVVGTAIKKRYDETRGCLKGVLYDR